MRTVAQPAAPLAPGQPAVRGAGLDLLLLTVATPRKVHPDGIHFQSLRYLDPVLAAYTGESVVIRYDPRDMAEIRIFHHDRFLCRAICPELANRTISLKEITAARNARRKELRTELGQRASVVDRLIAVHRAPRPDPAADAVRRERYIGLCYGPPGVGKTLSARRYASWPELLPMIRRPQQHFAQAKDHDDWHTVLYTPPVGASPRMTGKELIDLGTHLAMIRTPDPFDERNLTDDNHASPRFVELLIVDEADRLKTPALEQLRDHYNRSHLGMILIGMPGIEKTLARYPQLYSRIGFVHEYQPLSPEELTFVLQHRWSAIGLTLSADDFTDTEALAAVHRITNGNFRLVHRLFEQITRVLEINGLRTISKEVAETARANPSCGRALQGAR